MDATAVLPDPLRLRELDPLSASDPLEQGVLAGVEVLWYQQEDRPAHDLSFGVPEHLLCRRIPAGDRAIQRLADDRVTRRGDDGGEAGGGVPDDVLAGPRSEVEACET